MDELREALRALIQEVRAIEARVSAADDVPGQCCEPKDKALACGDRAMDFVRLRADLCIASVSRRGTS
jgi:hypothetical protein